MLGKEERRVGEGKIVGNLFSPRHHRPRALVEGKEDVDKGEGRDVREGREAGESFLAHRFNHRVRSCDFGCHNFRAPAPLFKGSFYSSCGFASPLFGRTVLITESAPAILDAMPVLPLVRTTAAKRVLHAAKRRQATAWQKGGGGGGGRSG
jgi:hypothetical protein